MNRTTTKYQLARWVGEMIIIDSDASFSKVYLLIYNQFSSTIIFMKLINFIFTGNEKSPNCSI